MFKENWAFNHVMLTRVLSLNIFSTFQSINAVASIDWASYKSSRQTFNLTLVGSEDSFLSLLLSVRLFPLPPQQLLPSLFLLLLLLLWLCPVLLPQCSAPNSERCGSVMIAATERASEGTVTVEEAGTCSSHQEGRASPMGTSDILGDEVKIWL